MSNFDISHFDSGMFRLTGLSCLGVLADSLVSLNQASCDGVCLDFEFQAKWQLQGLKLHSWMVMAIRQEWSYPGRSMYRVIVREFG
jgi:hypothetical protein